MVGGPVTQMLGCSRPQAPALGPRPSVDVVGHPVTWNVLGKGLSGCHLLMDKCLLQGEAVLKVPSEPGAERLRGTMLRWREWWGTALTALGREIGEILGAVGHLSLSGLPP